MGYAVGVDLGTTYTAAATFAGPPSAGVTMVTLGHRSTAVPTVVYAAPEGHLLVGDRAVAAGLLEPSRRASEFKRRFGDTTPLLLGGRAYSPPALLAAVLGAVTAQLRAEMGADPARMVLTHPANWGPYKRELLGDVISLAGVDASTVELVTEPEAAATWYAHNARVGEGTAVAVYDLGGGTFDAATVRHRHGRFVIDGQPRGIEQLGGVDFDHAVMTWLVERLGINSATPRPADVDRRIARQRGACTEAREALSTEAEVDVADLLTDGPPVRLDRATLEGRVQSLVDATVSVLLAALEDASGRGPVERILLVGGASRMPLVAHRLSEALDRPVTVDAHPKNAVALGAALAAGSALAAPAPGPTDADTVPSGPVRLSRVATTPTPSPTAWAVARAGSAPPGKRRSRILVGGAAAALAVALVALGIWRAGRSGDGNRLVAGEGAIVVDAPDGWRVWQDQVFERSLADGTGERLGPHQLLIMPGDQSPGGLIDDPRPSLLVGLAGPEYTVPRAEVLWSFFQEDSWNTTDEGVILCPFAGRPLSRPTPAVATWDLDNCDDRVAGGLVAQVREIDGGGVALLLARYNEAQNFGSTDALELMDGVAISSR